MEHQAINWIQIPATDLERAVIFYNQTLGFKFVLKELNSINHALIQPDETGRRLVNGAIIEVEEVAPGTGPILFFDATGKFEHMIDAIPENGGKVLKPKTLIKNLNEEGSLFIPDTYIDNKPGYFAHFIDSEGNRMGLYGTN